MELLKLIGTFLIQPLLWLGILWAGVCYALRIRSDRRNFKIALNKDCFEIRHFIKKGILWGVSGSLISLIIGCYLPLKAIILYEILAAVAVLCISRIDLSDILGILAVLRQPAILPVVLLLLGFNYLVKGRLTHGGNAVWFTPQIKQNRRKRRLAVYRWSEFTVLPLMIYIPGTLMEKLFHFLPLIHFGEVHFSLFILPFFVDLQVNKNRAQYIEVSEGIRVIANTLK